MDWIERLKQSMAYIEENLEGDIDWHEAAKRALCSTYLFMRTFGLLTGIPLSEYVRRRRLTLAALALQDGAKVLDVALRFGYASPTAFQRAFTQFHGVTPMRARKPGAVLLSFPPMSFHLSIQGGIALQYRIEEKPGFRIVGYKETVSMLDGENFRRIPKIWEEMPQERYKALEALSGTRYPGMFGVITMSDQSDALEYYVAVESSREDLADWMDALETGTQPYAVFDTSFADLQDTTRRIFSEWLPSSGYEHADAPEYEYYPKGDMTDNAKYMCEIWIPVVKK